jgi:hypothetical protein
MKDERVKRKEERGKRNEERNKGVTYQCATYFILWNYC